MNYTKLYLVKGIKFYKAWQGDSGEEIVKLLVPANDEKTAKDRAMESGKVDEVAYAKLIYEVVEGCNLVNGVWDAVSGIGDKIESV